MVTLKWTGKKGDQHSLHYNGPIPVAGEKIQLYDFNSKYIGALQAAEQLWQLRQLEAGDRWDMDVTVNCIWISE